MNLPDQYRRLLAEYAKVLNLSRKILEELKKEGKESELDLLLEKRKAAGETIAGLTEQIASANIRGCSESSLRTLAQVKGLLQQVIEKVKLLQEVEQEIQDLLGKRK